MLQKYFELNILGKVKGYVITTDNCFHLSRQKLIAAFTLSLNFLCVLLLTKPPNVLFYQHTSIIL